MARDVASRWARGRDALWCALPPRVLRGGGSAVAGRRSGDVVTAGLNSSRV
ncbi:hypothetical protein F511_46385 [Dorcoceras hygrometricum]|uniref:Uncharacterized protein n=1 Tax=Dorcoceras hygrometricum TaxID=472368 RepID=A0A2Z6ZUS5_9LAMI|nr:hypothetical protein F511_46385 [Dorcoceras hygrometricum]